MNFLNSVVGKINTITKKLSEKYPCVEITDRLYHIQYPNSINQLEQIIPSKQSNIQIWNLSQYKYPPQLLEELTKYRIEPFHLTYEYYSSIPLTITITKIKQISKFLSSSENNVVFIHCQSNKGRSSVFLAIYVYLTQLVDDIAMATAFVNKKLQISAKNETIYGSQHTFLKHIAIYQQDPKCINKHNYRLLKIIINHAPKIPQIQHNLDNTLKTYIEIRKGETLICTLVSEQFGQGQVLNFSFENKKLILQDDCLISLKYISNKKLYPVIRLQINTNFIFNNFLRLQMQEIDIVGNASSMYVFVDLMFEPIKQTETDLWKLNNQSNEKIISPNEDLLEIEETKKEEKIVKKQSNSDGGFDINENDDDFDEGETQERINKMIEGLAIKTENNGGKIVEIPLEEEDKNDEEEDMDDYFAKLESQA